MAGAASDWTSSVWMKRCSPIGDAHMNPSSTICAAVNCSPSHATSSSVIDSGLRDWLHGGRPAWALRYAKICSGTGVA